MKRRSFLASSLALPVVLRAADARPSPPANLLPSQKINPTDWVFLDNGVVRLGVKKISGAGVAWFSKTGEDSANLLDHYDHGRLVQQSYYGAEDGSKWVEKPWRWNPVQGGDYRHNAAEVKKLETTSATSLHSQTIPRNWAGGELLTDVLMEQWIVLNGAVAEMRFKFTYSGDKTHPVHDQEIPAFFCPGLYTNLVLYDGDKPWTNDPNLNRSRPGWPNESRKMTENWAAYLNDDGQGVGLYVPVANHLTCYRFGSSPTAQGACSYFAPLEKFAVTPGFVFDYRLHLTLGTVDEMRARFRRIRAAAQPKAK